MSAKPGRAAPSRLASAAPSSSRVDSRTVAKRQCSAIDVLAVAEDAEVGLGVADVDDQQHARANYSQRRRRRGGPPAPPGPGPARPARRPAARPSGSASSGSSSSSGTSTNRRELDLGVRAASAARSGTRGRRAAARRRRSPAARAGAPPAARPTSRSTALQASSSSSGPSSVSIRTQALRKSGWSSTRPTGSVSYSEEEASTCTPCPGSAATAAARWARRSPTLEPRPR